MGLSLSLNQDKGDKKMELKSVHQMLLIGSLVLINVISLVILYML